MKWNENLQNFMKIDAYNTWVTVSYFISVHIKYTHLAVKYFKTTNFMAL